MPKQLNPLKLDDQGLRLLFWDSTYTTPHLKPEFNGEDATGLSFYRFVDLIVKEASLGIGHGSLCSGKSEN